MYFGVDYHPEQWVYPYGGTREKPEAAWERDIELMQTAGINVVRMGEFTWGLCEPEEGKYDFGWLKRVMDLLGKAGIKVVLATPTAAPPIWLAQKHPEILPVDERGLVKREGTRRAVCLNSDVFWDYSKRIVENMAKALGQHPQLIAWQIDNGLGGNFTEASFNEDTRRDWHLWLEAKYETIERLNELMGLRHWGQVVKTWKQVPMPMAAPTVHNPALVLDWCRFCSDTIVQFVKMQADLLHQLTPKCPVTTNLRPLLHRFDHFDLAEVIDFVSIESTAALQAQVRGAGLRNRHAALAQEDGHPDAGRRHGVLGDGAEGRQRHLAGRQLAGAPGGAADVHLSTGLAGSERRSSSSAGASRASAARSSTAPSCRTTRDPNGRVFKEVAQLGDEMKLLAPALKGTRVQAETCILYSHDNDWALQQPMQPNKFFSLREHIQLFYNALHDRNIAVDFARPTEDLSRYKLVFAPSLHLLSGGEADRLKLYVQNGGTLVATFNTGLVDEHNMAPDTGYPHDLTDLFGLEVLEFDQLPPGEENHLTFKGTFPSQPHAPGPALVRHHRAEGLPGPRHLRQGFLRRAGRR